MATGALLQMARQSRVERDAAAIGAQSVAALTFRGVDGARRTRVPLCRVPVARADRSARRVRVLRQGGRRRRRFRLSGCGRRESPEPHCARTAPRVPVPEKCNMAMVASNMSGHIQKQLTRSLERILEEAHLSGELKLSGRKLKDFPKVGKTGAVKYNLQDTVIAGESSYSFPGVFFFFLLSFCQEWSLRNARSRGPVEISVCCVS